MNEPKTATEAQGGDTAPHQHYYSLATVLVNPAYPMTCLVVMFCNCSDVQKSLVANG